MAREIRLTTEAAAKLERLKAVYSELGLSPDQALALTLAEGLAEQLTVDQPFDVSEDDTYDLTVEAEGMLGGWLEDSRESWRDVLSEVAQYLTDKSE
jgi:hypothetical protein